MPASRSRQISITVGGTAFVSVGPMPPGSLFQSLHIVFHGLTGAQGIQAAFALTSRRIDAATNLETGTRIIDEGDQFLSRQPRLDINIAANSPQSFTLRPLILISGGPRFLSAILTEITELTAAALLLEIVYLLPEELAQLTPAPGAPSQLPAPFPANSDIDPSARI